MVSGEGKMSVDRCVCCGGYVPEGSMVCMDCAIDLGPKQPPKTRYYVVSDVHGFYTEMIAALKENGWFEDNGNKRLILCGDMMDRGQEAVKMQKFMCDLMDKGELIFIRGNHEDLMLQFIEDYKIMGDALPRYHITNGTFSTAIQLTGEHGSGFDLGHTPFVSKLIPSSINYFETDHYIFVHGWVPVRYGAVCENWRVAGQKKWDEARWLNGMEQALYGNTIPGKTIVCGHWHTSWGRAYSDSKAKEWGPEADFSPFYADGIIAIDACTAYSGKVNCLVLED